MNIQELVDKKLIQEPYEGSGKIVASGLGQCYRQQYFRRTNKPQSNPPDARALRVFMAGNLFHKFVQDIMVEQGYEIEVKYEDEDIKLRADLVSNKEVVDLKSQHSRGFWYMKNEGYDVRREKYLNWLQVMLGCKVFEKPYGRLCFISKDDLCIAEYIEPYKGYWEREVEKELAILRQIWTLQQLPPAQPRCSWKSGNECQYCNWRAYCKEVEKNEKNQINTR